MNRQQTIINYLKVKPTTKGEVEVDSLHASPPSKVKTEMAKKFLEEQGVNFQPLLIREIDDFEYEVLYGNHWVDAAIELGINRLQAWVIDEEDDDIVNEMVEMIQMLS